MYKKLTEEKEQEICSNYLWGDKPKKIAEKNDVCIQTVYWVLKKHGCSPSKDIKEQHEKIIKLYTEDQKDVNEIASGFDIPTYRVYYVLKTNNIKLRPNRGKKQSKNNLYKAIIDLYKLGYGQSEIAELFGITRQRVYQIIDENEVR